MKKRIIHSLATAASLVVFPIFLNSCVTTSDVADYFKLAELSVLPNEIPKNASPRTVRSLLGEPVWTEVVSKKGDFNTHVWHYEDRWHTDGEFGSWNLYFQEIPHHKDPKKDPRMRYVGWRLTEPRSAETGDREAFHVPRRFSF